MKDLLVLNDSHLSVKRVAGTTYDSVLKLRQRLQQELRKVMLNNVMSDILFAGDLFDQYLASLEDVLAFYGLVEDWLSMSEDGKIWLMRGNHDVSKDSTIISSLDFVGAILQSTYPQRVFLMPNGLNTVNEYTRVVTHVIDQKTFDKAIKDVPKTDRPMYLILHCNFDNPFAGEKDHSLNLSATQAKRLKSKGYAICLAHEHKARQTDLVTVFGNQFPTSISDCINVKEKSAHLLRNDGKVDLETTWWSEGQYEEIDWRKDLNSAADCRFIRVVGSATAEQAPTVVDRVSKLRQVTDAFIVGNGVRIDGVPEMSDVPSTVDALEQFDLMSYLFENLSAEQTAVVKQLVEKYDVKES